LTETDWLHHENGETRRLVTEIITQYDDAKLTLTDAKHKIALVIEASMKRVYDHAFTTGVGAAALDGDSDEEEYDFEITEEGDEDGDDEHHPE
jgi:hypothetical protein